MKEERALSERINLLEQEMQTLVSEIQKLGSVMSEIEDLKFELKGIKVFLGRVHPDFKNQLPEIVRKLKAKKTLD